MKKSDIIISILLMFNIFIIGYFFIFEFQRPAAQCLNDPLVYGAKEIQKVNQYPLQCSCGLLSPNPSPILHFNSEGRRFEKPLIENYVRNEINFTEVLLIR